LRVGVSKSPHLLNRDPWLSTDSFRSLTVNNWYGLVVFFVQSYICSEIGHLHGASAQMCQIAPD
jgi:hypothetical protein